MVLPHFVYNCAYLSVKIVEKALLLLVMPVNMLKINGVAFFLNSYYILEEIHNLMVPGVVGILRVVGQDSCFPIADFL